MQNRTPFTFSLRRLLLIPIAFGVVFAVLPTVGTTIPAFVAATAVSGIVCLVNKNNWHRVAIVLIGCILGYLHAPYAESRSTHYRMEVGDAVLVVFYKVLFGVVTFDILIGVVRKIVYIRRYARDDGRPANAVN